MEYTQCQVTVTTMYTDVVSLYNVQCHQNSDTKCHYTVYIVIKQLSVWLHNVTIQCIVSSNSDSSVHSINVQCTVSLNSDSVHSMNVQCTVLIVYTASIYSVARVSSNSDSVHSTGKS